jgi:methyltransferase (TIGR00027 family)
MAESHIENVSDTARWVAMYRAIETDRRDALFRDPYARRLAAERGERIARTLPGFRGGVWPMVTRTCVIDEMIVRAVERDGADTVVNLAAGLDARPWRMALPRSLRWYDVDLPGILGYKVEALRGETLACVYVPVALDLTLARERRALFARIGAGSRHALVLSEGLLVYLADEEVSSLAADLHAVPSFRWWILDLISRRLLPMLQKRWGSSLESAPLRFAPPEGTRFFEKSGWREDEFRSTFEEAQRLKRAPRAAWLWRLLSRFAPPERREAVRRMGGIVRMRRIDEQGAFRATG